MSPLALRALRSLLPLGLVTTAALAIALGVSSLVWQPAQTRVANALESYEAARQAQIRQEASLQTQKELVKVWAPLPVRKEFADLILEISDLAYQDQLEIPGMNYSFKKVEGDLATQASINFRAAGSYRAVRRFIHRLETAAPYLFIERLDVARREKTKGRTKGVSAVTTHVAFNIRLVTFLKPSPENTAGPA